MKKIIIKKNQLKDVRKWGEIHALDTRTCMLVLHFQSNGKKKILSAIGGESIKIKTFTDKTLENELYKFKKCKEMFEKERREMFVLRKQKEEERKEFYKRHIC